MLCHGPTTKKHVFQFYTSAMRTQTVKRLMSFGFYYSVSCFVFACWSRKSVRLRGEFISVNLLEDLYRPWDSSADTYHQKSLLVIGILSHHRSVDRRNAIRSTWLKATSAQPWVARFFTDDVTNQSDRGALQDEITRHRDIVLMPDLGSTQFTKRLLWMMEYFNRTQSFDFFLRIDDDHFLCLDRLLRELPHRPRTGLYWGYLHCRPQVVRIDEGWLLLSADLISHFISKRNTTLLCHPYGDQAVALWVEDSSIPVTVFADNARVRNDLSANDPARYLQSGLCGTYLSLHGSYPDQMRRYWALERHLPLRKSGSCISSNLNIPPIPVYEDVCRYPRKLNWKKFWPQYRFEPKPCRDDPSWDLRHRFRSRQETGELFA